MTHNTDVTLTKTQIFSSYGKNNLSSKMNDNSLLNSFI